LDTSTLGAGAVQAMKQLGAVRCAKRDGAVVVAFRYRQP